MCSLSAATAPLRLARKGHPAEALLRAALPGWDVAAGLAAVRVRAAAWRSLQRSLRRCAGGASACTPSLTHMTARPARVTQRKRAAKRVRDSSPTTWAS